MKSKYFTPELARFLFDKGLLTIAERRHKGHNFFGMKPPFNDLLNAFFWIGTKEGHNFWQKINDEYDNK